MHYTQCNIYAISAQSKENIDVCFCKPRIQNICTFHVYQKSVSKVMYELTRREVEGIMDGMSRR